MSSHYCSNCDRRFGGIEALQQHFRDSPAHAFSFDCDECDRSFDSEGALNQHLRDSPVHKESFDCDDCDRSFDSDEALQQHLRDSPAHAFSFDCDECDRSFDSDEALQQHLRDSPAHAFSFDCNECDRSFDSEGALNQHLRDSPAHREETLTPLDEFFFSFPNFDYNPSLPPATSYNNLRRHEGWQRGSPASKDAWNRYQDALQSELSLWFGDENDLTAWHALCRAVGVRPLPLTCEQCERAVRRKQVNLIDLIEWGRSGSEAEVRIFPNLAELREYTLRTGKIFRNRSGEGNGNIVLRHLLRHIFRESL